MLEKISFRPGKEVTATNLQKPGFVLLVTSQSDVIDKQKVSVDPGRLVLNMLLCQV